MQDDIRKKLEPLFNAHACGYGLAGGGSLNVHEWIGQIGATAQTMGFGTVTMPPATNYDHPLDFIRRHNLALQKQTGPVVVMFDASENAQVSWMKGNLSLKAMVEDSCRKYGRVAYIEVSPGGDGRLNIAFNTPAP